MNQAPTTFYKVGLINQVPTLTNINGGFDKPSPYNILQGAFDESNSYR